MRDRYVELLGDALKIEPSATRLPLRHRRGLLRHRVPALLGDGGADPRLPAHRVRQRPGSRAARPATLLLELWSEGQERLAADDDAPGAGREAALETASTMARRARDKRGRPPANVGDVDGGDVGERTSEPPARRAPAGAPTDSPSSPTVSRARKSSTRAGCRSARSTTASSVDMLATSSRCSERNQCRNCSPTRSPSSRASAASAMICSVTRRSCSSASATGRDRRQSRSAARRRPGSRSPRRRRAGTGRSSSRGSAPRAPAGRSARRAAGSVSASK